MAKKILTPDEIAVLRSSPFVKEVISGRVIFTTEFKTIMYEELISGKTVRTILEEHGLDPAIFGEKRLWGISSTLRKNGAREEGFADLRCENKRLPAKETKEQALAAKVKQMEHELAYTRQEVEFLKKMRMADLEAQKSWESKQRRK